MAMQKNIYLMVSHACLYSLLIYIHYLCGFVLGAGLALAPCCVNNHASDKEGHCTVNPHRQRMVDNTSVALVAQIIGAIDIAMAD